MLYFDTKAVFRQKRISKTSKQAWKAVILSCLLPVIYVLLIKHFYILHYAINDDINMKSIVSGAFTGIPDAHMIYTKYPLGIVLKLLYQISAGVDWYGMYLMGIHLLGLAILTFRACSMGRTRIESIVLVAGVYLVYSVCVYSELIAIQYTTTGAFLAGVAVFWLVTGGKCKTKAGTVSEILVAIIMLLLVYCIRLDVFLVAFAMSCIVYVGIYWVDEKNLSSFWRESLIFAVCLGVCILIQAVGYRTEDWKTFLHFNEVREELYDYEQFPEYEENREWYESFGIDENDYLALCSSNIAISGIEDIKIYDSLLEKYHASGSRADRKTELAEAVTVFKSQFTDERLVPFHVIILLLSGLTFFFSRKEKRK